jgi:NAD+ synthase (glutamine-hydrolysing)
MQLIRVAAAVLNQTPLDWRGNRTNVLGAIAEARRQGASVLCLPELCLSGYGCEDTFQSPNTLRQSLRLLRDLLPATGGLVVSVGLPLRVHHGIFNAAALIADGRLLGFVGKQHLAGDGIHYEPRWFKPWPAGVQDRVEWDEAAESVPVGDLCFEIGGVRFGFEICEDAWVATRPGIELARRGVDVILNPSASHFAFGKIAIRERFVLEGSRAFGCTYVYANLLGNEAGRAIYDGEALIATGGRLVATGPRFSYADVRVTSATVDLDVTRLQQARLASFRPGLGPEPEGRVEAPFAWPKAEPTREQPVPAAWEASARLKEEEFARAVPLALFDYLRKSRSRGFVVSLSGGADSSAITCLVSLMVRHGVKELGLDGFRRKLAYIPGLDRAGSASELTRALLTTAYQGTANSGPVTRAAARAVAEAVGAEHHELDIAGLHAGYLAMVAGALGRELDWTRDDLALQNIQARVRSPGIWMLANVKGALLLSTSNRSEAAVGYATMDGDTSGGLAPIAGIDKAWLREWLVWLEREGPLGLDPIPALAAVNAQAPTAELRPPDRTQTDEADLMPYPLLDAIERAAVRDKQSPLEAFRGMRLAFPGYEPAPAGRLGRALLPPLVPQSMEAGTLRAELPPRRREPRPEDLVPVPDPEWRVRSGTRRIARPPRHPRARRNRRLKRPRPGSRASRRCGWKPPGGARRSRRFDVTASLAGRSSSASAPGRPEAD